MLRGISLYGIMVVVLLRTPGIAISTFKKIALITIQLGLSKAFLTPNPSVICRCTTVTFNITVLPPIFAVVSPDEAKMFW